MANDWEETYDYQYVALLRLGLLAACSAEQCAVFTHDAETFAQRALTFIEANVE